jgi:lipid-A-disaccharide synthase
MTRLLLTANSPGEMAGWVRPLVRAWRSRGVGPVDLLLLPCAFATGQEERVARELEGVDRIYRPSDYARLLWRDGREYRDGALLHLGGDLMYSAFLSWRWKLNAWSYLWARPWWNSAFTGFFTKDEWGVRWLTKRRVPPERIHLFGDLVLDSVRQEVAEPPSGKRQFQVSYLPGSRAVEVAALTPLFLEVHALLCKRYPGLQGVLHLSPFLPGDQVTGLLESPPDPALGGLQGRLEGQFLQCGASTLLVATGDNYQRLGQSMLALSIPGTKTAEAGYLRTPVVSMTPLNRPEHLPSIGLVGLLDFLPGGKRLKGRLMLRMKPRIGLLAHPNILAGRALLPEILDVVDAPGLARTLAEVMDSQGLLESVQTALESLYPWDARPSERMVEALLQRESI